MTQTTDTHQTHSDQPVTQRTSTAGGTLRRRPELVPVPRAAIVEISAAPVTPRRGIDPYSDVASAIARHEGTLDHPRAADGRRVPRHRADGPASAGPRIRWLGMGQRADQGRSTAIATADSAESVDNTAGPA